MSTISALPAASYKVIPQVKQRDRLNAEQLKNYYITHAGGGSVPLSTIVSLKHGGRAGIAQPLPAAQFGHDLGGARRRASPSARPWIRLKSLAEDMLPQGYSIDYARPVAPVCTGIQRASRDVLLRADHHLPVAGGAVRELPRSVHRPHQRADVDLRRHDLHQPGSWRCQPEHLYRGGTGDADRPHQQARHPDRAVCQRPAARREGQARSGGNGRRRSGCGRS